MQQKNPGKAMCYLVAICALVSALALVGCSGGDGGNDGGLTNGDKLPKGVDTGTLKANNSTVQALEGQQFTLPGSLFDPSLVNNQATLVFTAPTQAGESFDLTPNGAPKSSGNTTFGSCIFTFNQGSLAIPGKLPVIIDPCTIDITSGPVTAGGGTVPGTLTFILGTISFNVSVRISLDSNGILLVNNKSTGIKISADGTPITTGSTGAGGL